MVSVIHKNMRTESYEVIDKGRSLDSIIDSNGNVFADILRGIADIQFNEVISLYGCVNSGTLPTYSITAGSIFHDGEFYRVDAFDGDAPVGQVPVLEKVVYYKGTDPTQYNNGTQFRSYKNIKLKWKFSYPGSGIADFSQVQTLFKRINYDLLDVPGQITTGITGVPDATDLVKGIAKLYNDLNFPNTDGSVTQAAIKTAIDLKAPIANPTFTGNPTAPTAALGTDTQQIATTAFVNAAIAANVVPLDPTLEAMATVATVADRIIYFTDVDVAAPTTLTAYGRSLIDDVDEAAARTTLGGTVVGQNLFTVPDPSSIKFIRINADNTVTLRDGGDFLNDIGGVQTNRQLTINGTAYDLSADRSWTVGDVSTSGSYADPSWITSLSASKITGVLDISNIPASAFERIYVYAGIETLPENAGLTLAEVQNGDIVKMNSTGLFYAVYDDTQLNSAAGYVIYNAGTAASVPWSGVTGTPTTLGGYGIIDAWRLSGTSTFTNPVIIDNNSYDWSIGKIGYINSDDRVNVQTIINYSADYSANYSDRSLIDRAFMPLTPGTNRSLTQREIVGPGTITVTNGSASITGTGTNFLDSTFMGVSFWGSIMFQDSGGTWYRIGGGFSGVTATALTATEWYSNTQILAGWIAFNSTYQGTSGTYSYFVIKQRSDNYGAAFGNQGTLANNYGFAFGSFISVTGSAAFGVGRTVLVSGTRAIGMGEIVASTGTNSFAGGLGNFSVGNDRRILASGNRAFIWSENNSSQTVGHGALAANSAILGGLNHNIASGATRSAILGGSTSKIATSSLDAAIIAGSNNTFSSGVSSRSVIIGGNTINVSTAVLDTIFMPKVRIGLGTGGSLATDNANTNVLVRNATTGEIELNTSFITTTGAWLTASGGTLTGANNIISNAANQINFTGTWTASANSQYHLSVVSTQTSRATSGDTIIGTRFNPTIIAASTLIDGQAVNITGNFKTNSGITTGTGGTHNGSSTFVSKTATGMTPGTYTNVSPSSTNGGGTGALFTVIVATSSTFTSFTCTTAGSNYSIGDTITFNGSLFGGGTGDIVLAVVNTVNTLNTAAASLVIGNTRPEYSGINKRYLDFRAADGITSLGGIEIQTFSGTVPYLTIYDHQGMVIQSGSTTLTLNKSTSVAGSLSTTAFIASTFNNPGTFSGGIYRASGTYGAITVAGVYQGTYTSGRSYTGSVGLVNTVSIANGGTGYTTGIKSTSGGTGAGATINVLTVSGGVITSVAVSAMGSNYVVGDVLTLAGGTGGTVTVTAVDFAGQISVVDDSNTFSDTKTNNIYTTINAHPTFTITSTQATGSIKGFYWNPTINSLGSFSHYAVHATSGAALFANSSAESLTANTKVDIRGIDDSTSKILRAANLSNNERFSIQGNGETAFYTNLSNSLPSFGISATTGRLYIGSSSQGFNNLTTAGSISATSIAAMGYYASLITTAGAHIFRVSSSSNSSGIFMVVGDASGSNTWSISAGSHNATVLSVAPRLNLTGGTHTIKGVQYDPTIVDATGILTHYAWYSTAGSALFGNSNTDTLTSGYKMDVRGAVRIASTGNVERFTFSDAGVFSIKTAPANDDALTQVLVRDGTTGEVKYRTAASMGGGHIIQNAGSNLTSRPNLNILDGLTAADDSGNNATTVKLGGALTSDIVLIGNSATGGFYKEFTSTLWDDNFYGIFSGDLAGYTNVAVINTSTNSTITDDVYASLFGKVGVDFGQVVAGATTTGAYVYLSTYNSSDTTQITLSRSDINARGDYTTFQGIIYNADYSANYTDRSLVDRGYALGAKTYAAKQTFFTSTTSSASINIPHGVAPSAPVDGDVWTTTTSVYARINGVTIDLAAGGGGGHVIENNGTPLTNRANLNFYGGLTAADNNPDTDVYLGGAFSEVYLVGDTLWSLKVQSGANFSEHEIAIDYAVLHTSDNTNGNAYIQTLTDLNESNIVKARMHVLEPSANEIIMLQVRADNKILASSEVAGFPGIQYDIDYSANFTANSLINKDYADATYAPISGSANYAQLNAANTFGDFLNIFRSDKLAITNPLNTFFYAFIGSAIVADRTITLPLLAADDTVVMETFGQTLTNKTVALGSNSISGTKAQFDTAVTDDNFAYIGQANVFTANQEISRTGGGANLSTLIINRPEVVIDDSAIGELIYRGFSSTSVVRDYVRIRGIMVDDTNTAEDGSLAFAVAEAGAMTDYMRFNSSALGVIHTLKPIRIESISNDNALTQILARDGTSHELKYRIANFIGLPAVNQTADGPNTNAFQAGATITAFDLVYMGSGGKWLQTDADAASSASGMLAISLESKNDTQAMSVALSGALVRNDTWNWTVGATLYVSTTPGAITETQPSGTDDVIRIIGFAVSADVIYFLPESSYITHV